MDEHAESVNEVEDPQETRILIVGGGIGGLACALALHRVGLKSVVLEKSDTLSTMGTTITLWTNAFRVLDVLGIGEQFRSMYTNILGPHEVRAVERKVLLEALADELPPGTIRFNSWVTSIRKQETPTDLTQIELQDGSLYSSKVVVGFDGVNSVVASWMGLEKAEPVGQVAIRGLAVFPEDHKLEDKVYYYVGTGVRSAMVPATSNKVYWFIIWNDWSAGWRTTEAEQLRAEAMQRVKGWSCDIHECIRNTPAENFVKNSFRHRLNSLPSASQVIGGVTVAGDASHPMTPNLGQGGCTALEDAIVLAQKLHQTLTLTPTPSGEAEKMIHEALLEFQEERHLRVSPLAMRSHRSGAIMTSRWPLYCFYRNRFILPKSWDPETFMEHTLFDVGKL